MGGYGSTRWGWHRTREAIDPLLWLDVRILTRPGALTPGTWSTTSWTSRGEPSGRIDHQAEADALILDYRTKGPADPDWRPVRERIALDATPCHYGGTRPWFLCPGRQRAGADRVRDGLTATSGAVDPRGWRRRLVRGATGGHRDQHRHRGLGRP